MVLLQKQVEIPTFLIKQRPPVLKIKMLLIRKKNQGSNSGSHASMSQSGQRRRRGTKRTAFSDSDSDSEDELSMEDLVKLVAEKEELLKVKHKEIETMQDKVLRTYAEMENVMDRTRREAENSKKFAIQSFAKTLLDVADNLGRAASVVKDSFPKVDTSKDTAGAVPLLETLLKGVEMTEKQLTEVLKKFGVEKYDPTNEQFDPNRHNAVFQVPDASKPPGTVAVVLKVGYMLHDRVLRPAEVGVTVAVDNEDMNQSNEA
ncbi:co-chaperone GrpE family protein [Actinidia rufa]|uniref:GrpE protein homolog n=1 Tax=Actinidia rufa TaxID=165716 RepID=A0A7J0G2G3_9ERIC|nr:co-chaperone GrpE family protein [Actinidia rufa]